MRAQTPSAHTTPASMPNVPTQIQPEYAVFFCWIRCLLWATLGMVQSFFAGTAHRIYPSQARYASDAGLTRGSLFISCTRKVPNATLLVLTLSAGAAMDRQGLAKPL